MSDSASLKIEVDSSGVIKATKNLNKLDKQSSKTENKNDRLKKSFSGLGSAIGALGLATAVMSAIKTAAAFETMAVSLETVTGSSEKAVTAMDGITEFAKNTPFQVSEITSAFIKLKALGIAPTEEKLKSFGNTSSAMGKSLDQMIEAVADAATGEFERLKEFGIKSKSQGDQVTFTFQGIAKTVGKNSKEITAYLEDIGKTKFAGAMSKQMNTMNGKISNLGDSFDQLAVKIFEDNSGGKGIIDYAINAVDFLNDGVSVMRIAIVSSLGEFDKFFINVASGAEKLKANIAVLWTSKEDNVKRFKAIDATREAELKAVDDVVLAYIAGQEKKANAKGNIKDAGAITNEEQKALNEATAIKEQEKTDLAYEAETDRMFLMIELDEQKLIDKLAFNEKMLTADQDYYSRLYNMQSGSLQAGINFAKAIRDGDAKSAMQNGTLMLSNLAKTSKSAFNVQKAFSLAKAAAELPSAVISSFNAAGGYPFGLIPAGLMLATGMQQIQSIKSATFGGGASPPSISGGGGGGLVGTSPSAPVVSGLPNGSSALPNKSEKRQVNITLNGAGYSKESVRELISSINEELGDGMEFTT